VLRLHLPLTRQLMLVLTICAASSACSRSEPNASVEAVQLGTVTVSVPRVTCLAERQNSQTGVARQKSNDVGFVFYLPSLERCDGPRSAEEFHENRVLVTVRPSVPDTAGRHPYADVDGALERLAGVSFVAVPTTDLYGLSCLPLPAGQRLQQCVGTRPNGERFLISVPRPPFGVGMTFPSAQTTYYSSEFGGVQVLWRVHVKHIGNWRQIDAHAWEQLRSWAATSPAAR
jgi:hypothetical protein